jgi:hypothetical protein
VPEIDYFQKKIEEIPGIFLNLSLNLNLAILKMRITVNLHCTLTLFTISFNIPSNEKRD